MLENRGWQYIRKHTSPFYTLELFPVEAIVPTRIHFRIMNGPFGLTTLLGLSTHEATPQ